MPEHEAPEAPANRPSTAPPADAPAATFVETAMRLSGKSDDEARRTGQVDRADEQVEALFSEKYQTAGSPIHKAVWDSTFPTELFMTPATTVPDTAKKVMDASLKVVRDRIAAGHLLGEDRKLHPQTIAELSKAGYWGLLVPKQYGGSEAPFAAFAPFLTEMAGADATVAGLASVHGCIGAVDPLLAFGSPQQKDHYLPKLASGEKLSAFALTEPNAGSDLTALRTTAELRGDRYYVNGEKLFITNAVCGATIGLVVKIDDKPAVLIADLPPQENESFQIKKYGLWALKHLHNQGMVFRDFTVPKENLLQPGAGDGLTIAYHGLNRGRVALCAAAAGGMRNLLAGMLPWAEFRITYGQAIEKRELVRARVAKLAGLIVATDAMTRWTGWLLDAGFRGEMECIIAKIFASEAQKHAAIEYSMKTHGGRSFLHGHAFGDNVHEFLAPCIYEGEGEMLGMAFFKSLVKKHGSQFFEPIGKVLAKEGIAAPNPMNPMHAWKLRQVGMPYARWQIAQRMGGFNRAQLPKLPAALAEHAAFAAEAIQRSRFEIDALMRRHALKLPDRQLAIAELSQRIQDMVVMLVTALHAGKQEDVLVQEAAEVFCSETRRKLTGRRIANAEMRKLSKLGEAIAEGKCSLLQGVRPQPILMQYER